MKVEDRIAARVQRVGDHDIWTGKVDRNGIPVTKHNSTSTTVRRLVWELAHGQIPSGMQVERCPDDGLCVRLEHLTVEGTRTPAKRSRAARGGGSKRRIRPGVWQLSVTAGRFADGSPRRVHRTVRARNETEATALLAEFVVEVRGQPRAPRKDMRDLSVDQAMELFLREHLRDEKGREDRTVNDYVDADAKCQEPGCFG